MLVYLSAVRRPSVREARTATTRSRDVTHKNIQIVRLGELNHSRLEIIGEFSKIVRVSSTLFSWL